MNGIEINKVYCENCEDTMDRMPGNYIDLVVTSPPYDNQRLYNGYVFNFENIAKKLYWILKEGGILVWVVNDETKDFSESGSSFRQALYFKDIIGFKLYDTMIYEKNVCIYPESKRYYPCFEYMFILSKGIPKTVNLIKDRLNRFHGKDSKSSKSYRHKDGKLIKKSKISFSAGLYGVRFNIWKYNIGKYHTYSDDFVAGHPAVFPEKLAIDHILSWSNKGDIVYDPMAGSGTVPAAAIKTDRNYIASEISSEYCNIINKRIDKCIYFDYNQDDFKEFF